MTKAEVASLLAYLAAAFPREQVVRERRPEVLATWADALADIDTRDAAKAARQHVAESVFWPTVADIRRRSDAAARERKPKCLVPAVENPVDAEEIRNVTAGVLRTLTGGKPCR